MEGLDFSALPPYPPKQLPHTTQPPSIILTRGSQEVEHISMQTWVSPVLSSYLTLSLGFLTCKMGLIGLPTFVGLL